MVIVEDKEKKSVTYANFKVNVKCPFCGKEYTNKDITDFDCECGARIQFDYGWTMIAWRWKSNNPS